MCQCALLVSFTCLAINGCLNRHSPQLLSRLSVFQFSKFLSYCVLLSVPHLIMAKLIPMTGAKNNFMPAWRALPHTKPR